MKKLFLLLLVILYSGVSQSQELEDPGTPVKYFCNDCNDVDSSIISFHSSNDLIEASTSIDAQAYYWEICGKGTSISGSNTNSEVLIDYEFNVKVVLTVFKDGDCITYCRELTGSVDPDPEPEPDPATCCAPEVHFDFVCRPSRNTGGTVAFNTDNLEDDCNFSSDNVDYIDFTVNGMFITSQGFEGQTTAILPPTSNGVTLYHPECIPEATVVVTFHFNNNCNPITVTETYVNPSWDSSLKEANDSDIEVYPNPTKNNLKFKVENLNNPKVEIFDFKGKKVLESNNLEKSLSIEKLKNGKYIYNIYNNNEIIKKGIIVKE